jgi:predicted TPR repeat methyltransferase
MRFKGVIYLEPQNAEAFYYLGRCHLEQQHKDLAIQYFEECLSYDKNWTPAHYFLSKLQFPERIKRINPAVTIETMSFIADNYTNILTESGYQGHIIARSILMSHRTPDAPAMQVLDLGCAGGLSIRALREKDLVRHATGIDLCSKTIAKLECELHGEDLLYNTLYAEDFTEFLAKKDSRFDAILAIRVLHHFSALESLLQDIALHLNPNGFLVGTYFPCKTESWKLDVQKDRFTHSSSYVKEEAKRHGLQWLEDRKMPLFSTSEEEEAHFFICQKI